MDQIPSLLPRLEQIPTWEDWDPDRDRYAYSYQDYAGPR